MSEQVIMVEHAMILNPIKLEQAKNSNSITRLFNKPKEHNSINPLTH